MNIVKIGPVAFTGTSAYPSYNGLSALRFRELMADLTRGVRYDRNRYGGTTRTSQVSRQLGFIVWNVRQ
nr:hypothetical protein BaRGS_022888 [Batillaria attramentaria]